MSLTVSPESFTWLEPRKGPRGSTDSGHHRRWSELLIVSCRHLVLSIRTAPSFLEHGHRRSAASRSVQERLLLSNVKAECAVPTTGNSELVDLSFSKERLTVLSLT